MNIIKTPIEGLLVIEPQVFRDSRGYFVETYNEKRYREAGIDAQFVQDNQSCSSYGVVRGLHFQRPPLSEENKRQFFIPRGFAHGFSVLSEQAIFTYKCDNLYHPEADGGILLNDPDLAIDWQIPEEKRIISEKDKHHPLLKDLKITE